MAAPTYTPLDWVDLSTDVDEDNMNHIEGGISDLADYAADVETRLSAEEAQPNIPAVENGKWLKGSGGALVYADIAQADVANLEADLAAKVPKSTVTTKGDLIVATGSAVVTRRGVGANNTLLYADSGQSDGVNWGKLVDAMVDAAANLAKLAAVTGSPNGYQFLRDDGAWINPMLLTAAPGSNQVGTGMTGSFTAGENLTFGDAVYLKSDGKVWKADANAAGASPCMGLSLGSIAANAAGSILLHGIYRDDSLYAFTVGGVVYLSTTAGAVTQTQPNATDDVIQVVGIATHADRLYFKPDLSWITHV